MLALDNLNRAAALAAIFQAANLVDRIATQGQIPSTAYEVLLDSLFSFDAESVTAIYTPGLAALSLNESSPEKIIQQSLSVGLRVAKQIFKENATPEYPQTIRYAMSLIKLQKQFARNTAMLTQVHDGLEKIARQYKQENNPLTQEQVAEEISKLYLDTLATLPFRIQVMGKMQYLQNTENEHRIRVLLFAGIRATMLWTQLGGRSWHFIFYKRKIAEALEHIAKG